MRLGIDSNFSDNISFLAAFAPVLAPATGVVGLPRLLSSNRISRDTRFEGGEKPLALSAKRRQNEALT